VIDILTAKVKKTLCKTHLEAAVQSLKPVERSRISQINKTTLNRILQREHGQLSIINNRIRGISTELVEEILKDPTPHCQQVIKKIIKIYFQMKQILRRQQELVLDRMLSYGPQKIYCLDLKEDNQ
jgi:hypothetical protein